MRRSDYCSRDEVQDFVRWAAPFVSGERPFSHRWHSPKWGGWSCSSIEDAYLGFKWPFSVTLPGQASRTTGKSFQDNAAVLADLSHLLRESAASKHQQGFLIAAIAVVNWGGGGSRLNALRLKELGDRALQGVVSQSRLLDPATADTNGLHAMIDMNAGFSKIYSLLINEFPIYDSRVAAAMCLLVRNYCEERDLSEVPVQLAFGVPMSQILPPSRRDPSSSRFTFPRLRWRKPQQYADSNLRSAWLLGLLADVAPFRDLPPERGVLALQSALFMIGYDIRNRVIDS